MAFFSTHRGWGLAVLLFGLSVGCCPGTPGAKMRKSIQVFDVDPNARTVMLNGGEEDGIAIGTIFVLSRNREDIGAAQVVEVLRRTCLARYTKKSRTPKIGDDARFTPPGVDPGLAVRVEPIRGAILESEEGGYRVRIDRGTDHGVFAGMLFDVVRNGTTIGRIRIRRVYGIRADALAVDRDEPLLPGDEVVEAMPVEMTQRP